MKIPEDAVIAPEKLIDYLLTWRPADDKSLFWNGQALSGSSRKNWRKQSASGDAQEDGHSEYGIFYRVEGFMHGPNGTNLATVLIWLRWHLDQTYHFVTLKPWKGTRRED